MAKAFVLYLGMLLYSGFATAQSGLTPSYIRSALLNPEPVLERYDSMPDLEHRFLMLSVQEDSIPRGMPLHTKLLWGRRGLLRLVGLSPSSRQAELNLRQSMLQWHQRLGLLTFGAMTTQVILGELIVANPSRHYEDLRPIHRTLGYATFGTYMATASLSLTAPPARRYGEGFSSVKLHRYLAILHFAGMIAQPILGYELAHARTGDDYNRLQRAHKWTGRATYAAFTLAILSIFLPY